MWSKQMRVGLVAATLALGGLMTGAQGAEPIRIGSFLSLSGPAAARGNAQLRTLQLYVNRINADGGVLERPLQLVHYDDGSDAAEASALMTQLLGSDQVDILVGGSTASTAEAAASLAASAGAPLIALSGAAQMLEPASPWVFGTAVTSRMAAESIIEDMRKRGISTIGLISSTSEFGQTGREQALAVASEQGIQIAVDETYQVGSTDLTAALTRIQNSVGVQAVLNIDTGQGAASVTGKYRTLGIDLPLYQSHGAASHAYLELAGEAAEGVRLPVGGLLVANQLPADDPQAGVVLTYSDAYREAYGVDTDQFGGYAHDGLMLAVEAIARAGSTDKAQVQEAIEQTRGLVGVTGVFNLSADDHTGLDASDLHMVEIQNGAWSLMN